MIYLAEEGIKHKRLVIKNKKKDEKRCREKLPVLLFEIKLTDQIMRAKKCDLLCS